MRKITELSIGLTAIALLALAGCGGGGAAGGGGGGPVYGTVSTFAGTSGSWGYYDASSAVAQFDSPVYIASDGTNLYVTDYGNNVIRQISLATGAVTTFAGNLTGASGVADGTGTTNTLFNGPRGIVSDGTNLYVADGGNNNIRQINISSKVVTTIAGSITGASGVANGNGTAARFNTPVGIAKIGTNLYVSDYASHTVRKIDLSTASAVVSTFAGSTAGYTTGYTGTSAMFHFPTGLTANADGTSLYVTDSGNNDIREINISTQMVSTRAGSTWINPIVPALGIAASGVADGTGTTARFNSPFAIASDGTNLYVSDTFSHTIRKIVIGTGDVSTLAGSAGIPGVTDAIGTSARFDHPRGLIYVNGALYIADWWNGSIRKIQL